MMKVAVLGSPFDPPHFGHLLIAQQTIDFGPKIDEVWLMPDFAHPWRPQVATPGQRLKMTSFLAQGKIKLSDWAIRRKKTSFTIDIVKELKQKFPYQFFWLVGSDTLKTLPQWKEAKNLIKEVSFLVFPRPGSLVKRLPPGFILINSPFLILSNLSSTKIRERVKRGLSILGMVPEKVAEFIKKEKIYQ